MDKPDGEVDIPEGLTDTEIRLRIAEIASNFAVMEGMHHQEFLCLCHTVHDWVDPAGRDRVDEVE